MLKLSIKAIAKAIKEVIIANISNINPKFFDPSGLKPKKFGEKRYIRKITKIVPHHKRDIL